MTIVDKVIERLRALPADKGEKKARAIDEFLDEDEAAADFSATDAHYAEAERRIALEEKLIPHDEVFAEIYGKLGK